MEVKEQKLMLALFFTPCKEKLKKNIEQFS
jgi:hypothetical protein